MNTSRSLLLRKQEITSHRGLEQQSRNKNREHTADYTDSNSIFFHASWCLSGICCLLLLLILASALPAVALVSYDEGVRLVNGIQLLRDESDPAVFYYLPQYPRLAKNSNGDFELLCIKYLGKDGQNNGGLFHALVEFTLPDDVLQEVEKTLQKSVPGSRIAGPVPLMQTSETGSEGLGSFKVISAILSDTEKGGFTRSVISSGKAPLMPGSKAAIAALLNQEGASLLWESFKGNASDVSIAISAYYEAAVKAYNAVVTANVEMVYNHYSRLSNVQHDYTRQQLRKISDELQQSGALKVEVLDRSEALGVDSKKMQQILDLVTDKLTELMFDHETGWAKEPERETAVEAGQIQGRQDRGWFSRTFLGAQDTKYYTDNQFVLKKRSDIRRHNFTLNLTQKTTIKVPIYTTGNLGGLYGAFGGDSRYFRVANLNDPAFEFRTVYFQIDGNYVDAFKDTINSATVNFRKIYGSAHPDFTPQPLLFANGLANASAMMQSFTFPRLGQTNADWTRFEYQVRWSLRDGPTLAVPEREDQWNPSNDGAIALTPPFERVEVEVEADMPAFKASGYKTMVVDFAGILGNEKRRMGSVRVRSTDSEVSRSIALYRDRASATAYRVSWHGQGEVVKEDLKRLDSDYLYILPPKSESTEGTP